MPTESITAVGSGQSTTTIQAWIDANDTYDWVGNDEVPVCELDAEAFIEDLQINFTNMTLLDTQ